MLKVNTYTESQYIHYTLHKILTDRIQKLFFPVISRGPWLFPSQVPKSESQGARRSDILRGETRDRGTA